jgi:hypothetical protein
MKNIIALFLIMLLPSCSDMFYSSSSSSQNPAQTLSQLLAEENAKIEANVKSYKGTSKQNLILNLGPPTSVASDGTNKGEVYSYIHSILGPYGTYTTYCYFYINEQNIVYFTKFNYTFQ